QGLRTGCNDFFYVHRLAAAEKGRTKVVTSRLFGEEVLEVPSETLRPVVHKQGGGLQTAQLLYLSDWYLPEDVPQHLRSGDYRVLTGDLGDHVRRASEWRTRAGHRIPELSAVRTNVSKRTGRRWYHVPPLAPRHLPDIYLPRVIGSDLSVEL